MSKIQTYITNNCNYLYHPDYKHNINIVLSTRYYSKCSKIKNIKKDIIKNYIEELNRNTKIVYIPNEKEFCENFDLVINCKSEKSYDINSKLEEFGIEKKNSVNIKSYVNLDLYDRKKIILVKYQIDKENSDKDIFMVFFKNNNINDVKKQLKKYGIIVKQFVNEKDDIVEFHETINNITNNNYLTLKSIIPTIKNKECENNIYGTIYLLQEREFINKNENVYKIGMTRYQPNKRLSKYPKDSHLFIAIACDNSKTCDIENKIIQSFNIKFVLRHDIGKEYFQGDIYEMIDELYKIVKNER